MKLKRKQIKKDLYWIMVPVVAIGAIIVTGYLPSVYLGSWWWYIWWAGYIVIMIRLYVKNIKQKLLGRWVSFNGVKK